MELSTMADVILPKVTEFFSLSVERYISAAIRGLVILGSLYLIFWTFKRPALDRYRVPTVGAAKPNPKKEALLTYASYVIYAMAGVVVVLAAKYGGHSMMYTNVADYGLSYTILSVFLFLFWVDTAFYWSHRLMHENRFFKRAHATHHQFVNVTPWAAYAFHSGEAALNAGAFMVAMLVIPFHPLALLTFVIISIGFNGYVHSGYDLSPLSWRTNPIMKWVNTPTHHIYHHQRPGYNFSFLFTFWDKIMGTEMLPTLTLAHKEKEAALAPAVPGIPTAT